MQLDLSGHHVEVTQALRGYVYKKFERISRHFEQLIDVHCVLTVEKLRHKAEATLMLRGTKIYADATDGDMYAAIDALTDKLDRCVKKHKEKISDHHAEEVIKARSSTWPGSSRPMRLIIVSGLSGSGKSVALHQLEDIDFYCVDNIPAALLKPFISHTIRGTDEVYPLTAVGLDARNRPNEIDSLPALVGELRRSGIGCEVLFLHASDEVLLKRYAETRRKHPLVSPEVSLREAIAVERKLLEPIVAAADLTIDTSAMGVHALRELIRERIDRRSDGRLALMFESFGYKHGIPGDADFVFDVRSLPNPYWQPALRHLDGRDAPVVAYLETHESVRTMITALADFLTARIAEFAQANRSYLTIAIGCTGGQHRSVYIAEALARQFRRVYPQVLTRHDSLQKA